MAVVRIIKDWDWPDLMRQTPGGSGQWSGIDFTEDDAVDCDVLLVLNNRLKHDIEARCPEGRVWALMQEPYVPGFTDWMAEGHEAFDRVYTSYIPSPAAKYILSQPALAWHVNRSFDELAQAPVPEKTRPLSWIVGNLADLPGHLKRRAFLHRIQATSGLDIDLYGRAVRFIEDKWDGLAQYRYSIAAENTVCPHYWTEKLADCFLSWTVPFYHGCPNLEDYFPSESFIRIDLNDPDAALAKIEEVLRGDDWARRVPALAEARRRVLYEYQLFPFIANEIRRTTSESLPRVERLVPRYRRSPRTRLRRLAFKARRLYLRAISFLE